MIRDLYLKNGWYKALGQKAHFLDVTRPMSKHHFRAKCGRAGNFKYMAALFEPSLMTEKILCKSCLKMLQEKIKRRKNRKGVN